MSYILYTYIFLSCWWKQTHLFETSTLRILCVTWRCWRITMLQSVRPWNLRRLEDLEVKRENPRNLQVYRASGVYFGPRPPFPSPWGSWKPSCVLLRATWLHPKQQVPSWDLQSHNLRFGQDGAERGLFGRYFVLVIPFFPKYTNDCIYLCLYINLHKPTEMKVIGKFVGIGSFATKSSNQDHHFHIHIFAGSRCKSCGRGLTFVHRAPGMVELGDVTLTRCGSVDCVESARSPPWTRPIGIAMAWVARLRTYSTTREPGGSNGETSETASWWWLMMVGWLSVKDELVASCGQVDRRN